MAEATQTKTTIAIDPVTRIEALRAYEEAKAAGARPGDTDIEVK